LVTIAELSSCVKVEFHNIEKGFFMADETKNFCKDIESHHVHLCTLSAEGRKEMVKCLTGRAEYKCGNCGIKANFPGNVCDPVQLPEIEWFGDGADNINLEGHCR
jgi:hypothetical protein